MTTFDFSTEAGAMTKLTFGRKKYWIGYHGKLGHIIYDSRHQSEERPGYVRLFVLSTNRSVSLRNEFVKNGMRPIRIGVDIARQLIAPYATRFSAYKNRTGFYI